MNYTKIVFFFLILFSGTSLFAQNSTSSPYSGFGIGELEMASGGRNAGMGQTGIALRSSLFLNTANPASLTTIEPQSFLFDMGVYYKYTNLQNSSKSVNVTDGNLSWIQMAFPISKRFFGGFSLNPKSSVGYSIYTLKTIDGSGQSYPSLYEGTGGLSEASAMLAYQLSKNISLGAKAGYLWGNLDENITQSVVVYSTAYTMIQDKNIRYSGSYFNFGTQVSVPLSAKSSIVIGGIAGISSRLNSETTSAIAKSYGSASETISSNVKTSGSMKLPLDIGGGISYLYGHKWVATADYRHCDWKDASINFSSDKLSTNHSYRTGVEFAPKNDPTIFRQVKRYRLGYRYESGYLKIFKNQIHEQAVTLGMGMPIRKDRSYANFSLELGMRGTKKDNLVQEKYFKLSCSFNLWERWFYKRQFD